MPSGDLRSHNTNTNTDTSGTIYSAMRTHHNSSGGIEDIVMTGCDHVTSKGVSSILKGSSRAPSLRHLDVSRCPRVTGDGLVPGPRSMLCTLRANKCNAVRSLVMNLSSARTSSSSGAGKSSSSSMLQELHLSACPQLTEASIAAPMLRYVNLSNCSQLSFLTLRCPQLTTLHLSGCSSLRIDPGNGGSFDCPQLLTVNLFGCRSFDSSCFEAILPSLGNVHDLDVRGCTSLGRIVAARGPSLGHLNRLMMDGCSVLRTVTISSTELTEVSAKGCRRLMVRC